MRRFRFSPAAILLAGLAVLAAPATGVASGPFDFDRGYDRIIGFGDSLSDPGNSYVVTGLESTAPYAPIPSAPYDTHRFTNGPTWLELLALKLGRPLSGKPAFLSGRLFSNYAFGGARARPAGDSPDLTTQVAAFLANNGTRDLDNSLIALFIGSNDVRDTLTALSTASTPAEVDAAFAIIPETLQAIASNVQSLYASGARSFIVLNVPNLAITPAVLSQGEPAVSTAAYLSSAFNTELDALLDQLESVLPGSEFLRLDVWSLLSSIAMDPESYGLTNTFVPCLSFGVIEGAVCDDADDRLFWDAIHPTTAAHGILAEAAYELADPDRQPRCVPRLAGLFGLPVWSWHRRCTASPWRGMDRD